MTAPTPYTFPPSAMAANRLITENTSLPPNFSLVVVSPLRVNPSVYLRIPAGSVVRILP